MRRGRGDIADANATMSWGSTTFLEAGEGEATSVPTPTVEEAFLPEITTPRDFLADPPKWNEPHVPTMTLRSWNTHDRNQYFSQIWSKQWSGEEGFDSRIKLGYGDTSPGTALRWLFGKGK